MNKQNYTSPELSKKLAENGCELESKYIFRKCGVSKNRNRLCTDWRLVSKKIKPDMERFEWCEEVSAYDLVWDICIKYPKEFFGDKGLTSYESPSHSVISWIIYLLQQNKKDKAENYIWKHCKFNPKNK